MPVHKLVGAVSESDLDVVGAVSESDLDVVLITPKLAQAFLERNTQNRGVIKARVKEYAQAMRDKRWRRNGETIKFSPDGSLLDGQHRLMACIVADVEFTSAVAFAVEPSALPTIDVGAGRRPGDFLRDCKNEHSVAAAIRWVWAIHSRKPTYGNERLTSAIIHEMWESDRRYEESVIRGRESRDFIGPGLAGGLHFLFAEKDKEAADQFFSDLAKGAGLEAEDPVLVLRERLRRSREVKKSKLADIERACLVIRAWNHRREGKTTKSLKGMITDHLGRPQMPEIL